MVSISIWVSIRVRVSVSGWLSVSIRVQLLRPTGSGGRTPPFGTEREARTNWKKSLCSILRRKQGSKQLLQSYIEQLHKVMQALI